MMITGCAILIAAVSLWKHWKIKQDVYDFAGRAEENLDALLTGKTLVDHAEEEESLWGKIYTKIRSVERIERWKEIESLEEKKRIKGLISDISHQTKTPIANQKIYLELLRQEIQTKEGAEFLERLEKQTDKLDFLFQSIVKISRLETGMIRIRKEETLLNHTLEQSIASIVPYASKKEIDLFAECTEEIRIAHDKKWTEEAVFNLLENAVKYTAEGGCIHILVCRQEIFTKISIKDSGKGISPERQAHIFTRFYREPEVHDKEGVGIGLYLAREIIELQNGYIEVHSKVGEGSEFCIYLPNRE